MRMKRVQGQLRGYEVGPHHGLAGGAKDCGNDEPLGVVWTARGLLTAAP